MASVTAEFRPDAAWKSLFFEVDQPTEPVMVVLDRHHVGRICTHLVSNAIKFTEEGRVTVRARDSEGPPDLVDESGSIRSRVRGEGIERCGSGPVLS